LNGRTNLKKEKQHLQPVTKISNSEPERDKTMNAQNPPMTYMTYEQYLDEVTTLLTEMYELSDEAAIKYVMRAQAANYFSAHDDHPEMCTQDRAVQDAKTVYEQRNKSRPEIYKK
jgi:hypothetical protein